MPYGLFGKVPQKRDFLSVNTPSMVLTPFETWLQSAVAASRNELGRTWQDHYLVSPIWRFWIGEQILGTAVAGALMPSVDQVGRYFPLSILYYAEPEDDLPPPLLAPLDHWYGEIEQRLLRALSEETDAYLGGVLLGLGRPDAGAPVHVPQPPPILVEPLPSPPPTTAIDPALSEAVDDAVDPAAEDKTDDEPPSIVEVEPPQPSIEDLPDTSPFDDMPQQRPPAAWQGYPHTSFKGGATFELGSGLHAVLGELRDTDYRLASAGRSYFWCGSSQAGPARMHVRQGLPDPYFFSRMILWEQGRQ